MGKISRVIDYFTNNPTLENFYSLFKLCKNITQADIETYIARTNSVNSGDVQTLKRDIWLCSSLLLQNWKRYDVFEDYMLDGEDLDLEHDEELRYWESELEELLLLKSQGRGLESPYCCISKDGVSIETMDIDEAIAGVSTELEGLIGMEIWKKEDLKAGVNELLSVRDTAISIIEHYVKLDAEFKATEKEFSFLNDLVPIVNDAALFTLDVDCDSLSSLFNFSQDHIQYQIKNGKKIWVYALIRCVSSQPRLGNTAHLHDWEMKAINYFHLEKIDKGLRNKYNSRNKNTDLARFIDEVNSCIQNGNNLSHY